MRRHRALFAILILAAVLRFYGVAWDEGRGVHPDERRIEFAIEEISFAKLQLNPHFFAYGSFPIYVQSAWTSIVGAPLGRSWQGFDGRMIIGRALSALVGIAMVAWVYALGVRLSGRECGLLAALFLSVAVLPIQHSHFITFDLYQALIALVALERLVAFAQDRRRRDLWIAAAVVGLALATKASSAPLLLPLAVGALVVRPSESKSGILRRLGSLLAALSISSAFFLLGEPYALFDPQFLHDIREQSEMVRHPGNMPYTIQYLGTVPYLDDLRQAFTWGMGPALGLVAALGTLAALRRAVREPTTGEILVLLFFVPYLLVTGWFPVKFMRYLLPLYPLWCVFAARILVVGPEPRFRKLRRMRTMRRIAAVVVAVLTLGYALAFANIFSRPHVWITASNWIYRQVPAGSTLLLPHWEEGLPLSFPGHEIRRYQIVQLPFYEADDAKKLAAMSADLAKGDVLIFPSKRIPGAITNAPERFPKTNRLLQLLYAGDLGYRLEASFASRPSLFGFELNDDFSDESFTVYDHPKTLIFRKTEALSAEEIAQRISSRLPSAPITRAQILAAGAEAPPPREGAAPVGIESSLLALALWLAALIALETLGRRLLAPLLRGVSAATIGGLGPVFGYLIFVYVAWLSTAIGALPFSRPIVLLELALLLVLAWRLRPAESDATARLVFYGSFLFFLAIRAGNPEVFWGEKPMDFSFLNALYRTTSLPPPEPWMSGRPINYPYFGHFGVAALGKLTHVAPALAFNLGIATIAALTAAAAFGLGALLSGRRIGGLAAAALMTFAGNLSGPLEYYLRRNVGFDYFWATSRVIVHTINEFPLWSLLFADLHSHVMVLPLSLLVLAFTCAWLSGVRGIRVVFAISLALGAVSVTNTWSFPVQAGALVGLAAVSALVERRPTRVFAAGFAVAGSFLWFAPFWSRFVSPPHNWGWEREGAPLGGVLLIFGLFLLVVLRAFLVIRRRRSLATRILLLLLLFGAAVAAIFSTRVAFAFLGATLLLAAFTEQATAGRLCFVLAAGAAWLGAAADTVFLWDRMNTIFKLYLEMWTFLAIACSFWLGAVTLEELSRTTRRLWAAAFAVALLASGFTAVTDVAGVLRTRRVPGPRPTLNGLAYLDAYDPQEADAIRWLNHQVRGVQVLLEAHGSSYQEFGRISMNTGLPAILGWDYHVSQRAEPWEDINRRKEDVKALYLSQDRQEVESLIDRYHLAIVYAGRLEERTYGRKALAKFAEWDDLFQPIFSNERVGIFAVARYFRWDAGIMPLESIVARSAAEQQPQAQAEAKPGDLLQPRGIAADSKGNLWVVDFGHAKIQSFDPDLKPLRSFGKSGQEAGEFRDPCGIAIGPDDRIYVADTWNGRVQVFGPDGRFEREWAKDFFGPRGIAVDAQSNVFIADTGNGRILKFTSNGEELWRVGTKGSGQGQFNEPVGIAVGGDGRIYVADAGNQRIVVLDSSGAPLETWPVPGWDKQDFREPYLAILPDGRVVAADPTKDRLYYFQPNGRFAAEQPFATDTAPVGVAVGAKGRLFVTELKKGRVSAVTPP